MKTTLKHFVAFMIALFAIVFTIMHMTSCNSINGERGTEPDSVQVANQVKGIVNPVFDNVGKVLQYKEELNTNEYEDSVFRQLSPQLVYNVATIVINRDGKATKTSIVKEYERGKDIYNSLPKDIPDSIVRPSEIDDDKPPVITTRDTIIHSKKVNIKTITTYEQRLYCRFRKWKQVGENQREHNGQHYCSNWWNIVE